MRKSSISGGRTSLIPLRVKNDSFNGSASRTSLDKSSFVSSMHQGTAKKNTSRPNLKGGVTGAVSKRSSFVRTGYHEHIKDPRPLSDKSYQQKCIRNLVEFLTTNGYPHQISPKVLGAPSNKDFVRIFEFIYRFLDENFVIKKLEDDVLRILKALGYPFNITKSTMYTIGTPHTWPTLLGALTWLSNLVEYAFNNNVELLLFPSTENDFDHVITESKLLFDFSFQTYKEFMNGADTFEALEEELSQQLTDRIIGKSGGIKELSAENQRLVKELQMLQSAPCRLIKLKDDKLKAECDEKIFVEYLLGLDTYRSKSECNLAEKLQEITRFTSELEFLKNSLLKKEQILSTQEFSSSDVEHFNKEYLELQRCLNSLEAETKEFDQQIWHEEMKLAKKKEQLVNQCKVYNNLAMALNLIPASAKNAQGHDLELRPQFNNDYLATQMMNNKVFLTIFKKQVVDLVHQLEACIITQTESLDQITEMTAEKDHELKEFENKTKRYDSDIERKKKEFQSEYLKLQEEENFFLNQIQELRKSHTQSVGDVEREILELKIMDENLNKELKQDTDKWNDFIWKVVKAVVEHKCKMNESVKQLHQYATELVDVMFASGYRPIENVELKATDSTVLK